MIEYRTLFGVTVVTWSILRVTDVVLSPVLMATRALILFLMPRFAQRRRLDRALSFLPLLRGLDLST